MTDKPRNTLAAERRKARHYGMQALYKWYMTGADLTDVEAEFRTEYDFDHVDLEYFQALLYGVPKEVDALDAALGPLLDRKLEELDPIESLKRWGGQYKRAVFIKRRALSLIEEAGHHGAGHTKAIPQRLRHHLRER